jgi:hypothetical protein
MAPLGYGVWTALKTNPALQWAVGIGALFIAYLTNNAFQRRRGRLEERAKAEKRARKVSDKIKRESNEKSKQVDIARRDAPRGVLNADELPKRTRGRIIRDDPDGSTDRG